MLFVFCSCATSSVFSDKNKNMKKISYGNISLPYVNMFDGNDAAE